MLSKYFQDFHAKILKSTGLVKKTAVKKGAAAKKTAGKGAAVKTTAAKLDMQALQEKLESIIPSYLSISNAKPIDTNGFSPDGADLLIYRPYCRDIVNMMGGYVPFELIHGACFVVPHLDKKTLQDVLNRVSGIKKISKYAGTEEEAFKIPAFIIAGTADHGMMDLKNDILNYYINNNIEADFEFDIFMVMNRGVVIKNWRESRSFISLETESDTMMWFFILMAEYLETERTEDLDFRKYIKTEKTYKQY